MGLELNGGYSYFGMIWIAVIFDCKPYARDIVWIRSLQSVTSMSHRQEPGSWQNALLQSKTALLTGLIIR